MNLHQYPPGVTLQPRLGPGLKFLLISCLAIFFLQGVVDRVSDPRGLFTYLFALWTPAILRGYVWQMITYMFLHGNLWHLILNMLGLFFFGREMEEVLGLRRFLVLYLLCGVAGGAGWMLVSGLSPSYCIGASGAVFGILGAFAAMFPYRRITLLVFFILPVTMTARTMILGLGAITVYSLFASDGNIAHAAHLAGGVAGYLYGRIRRGSTVGGGTGRPGCFRRMSGRSHLRVLPDEEPLSREEIDQILEKISTSGIGSLTRREREGLERASRGGE